jgi:hypothetical protein
VTGGRRRYIIATGSGGCFSPFQPAGPFFWKTVIVNTVFPKEGFTEWPA